MMLSNNVLIRIPIHIRCLYNFLIQIFIYYQRIADMYGMNSDLICRVIGRYRFSSDESDYRRYLNLEDFLIGDSSSSSSSGDMSREAYEDNLVDTEVELEKRKEKKLKGEGGVSRGVSRIFKEILEDYLPGGYFKWEDYARKLSNDIYKMAYAQFKNLLPKLISDKLKKFNVDRSEGTIETDPETINKVIMDSLIYLHDHPDILKDGLVRAYRRRESEEDRGVGIADAFFVPRIDKATLKERLKEEGGEDVKEGDADIEVLNNLKDRKEIKWKWKGIDEYGVLTFTLPDLYGSRQFTVKLPSEIQTIKPGTYTFKVKKVINGRGAVLEFKEQHDKISGNSLDMIEEDGLGEDQLRTFINNGVINKYITFFFFFPAEKLAENFLGIFTVGSDQISDADDLAQLIEEEGGQETSKGRGKEKVKEKYQQSVERHREKLRAMMQRWERAPDVAKYFLRIPEADGARLARAVASKFPPVSEKGVPSLDSIFATAPVVEMVLRYIMSPHMPLAGGGKSMPWTHFAWDAFHKMALKVPGVRESIEDMIRRKRKDKEPGLPVSDEDINKFLSSITNISMSFKRLRDKIAKVVEESRGDPELKRFFERRDIFKTYVAPQLENAVEEYIKENGLSLDSPEDLKKIEKFKDKYIKKLVDKMSKSASSEKLIHQLMMRMSSVR